MVDMPFPTAQPNGRVLVVSYAFPPVKAQMAPIVAKPMAGLARLGYHVDVVCAEPFSRYLDREECLLPYVQSHFSNVHRLPAPRNLLSRLRTRLPFIATTPDLMVVMRDAMYRYLMDLDLHRYDAVITWSPFHSINTVMVEVKRHRPQVRWIAQFSDPWAENPLERNFVNKLWSAHQEPRTVAAANFIVHSSPYSLGLMKRRYPNVLQDRSAVIVHPYDKALFPDRPRTTERHITLRYVGVLFGQRSPEPLFRALRVLFGRRPDLQGRLRIDLVGEVPPAMLETPAVRALPNGTVQQSPPVSYLASLDKMYDADILLLIDADVRENLFVPSKLSDYLGAGVPIVGITPAGGAWDILDRLDCWRARPGDIDGISHAIEAAVEYAMDGRVEPWCDEVYRQSFDSDVIAAQYRDLIRRL
jgi:glycosyltransferase involved in cell wall biosynthesis